MWLTNLLELQEKEKYKNSTFWQRFANKWDQFRSWTERLAKKTYNYFDREWISWTIEDVKEMPAEKKVKKKKAAKKKVKKKVAKKEKKEEKVEDEAKK